MALLIWSGARESSEKGAGDSGGPEFDTDGAALAGQFWTDPMIRINGQWQPAIRMAPGEIGML